MRFWATGAVAEADVLQDQAGVSGVSFHGRPNWSFPKAKRLTEEA